MKPVLMIDRPSPDLDISDLNRFGELMIVQELAVGPEPTPFDVEAYMSWLASGLPDEDFDFVIIGSSIKTGLMMALLADYYEEFGVLMFDARLRRYFHQTIRSRQCHES